MKRIGAATRQAAIDAFIAHHHALIDLTWYLTWCGRTTKKKSPSG